MNGKGLRPLLVAALSVLCIAAAAPCRVNAQEAGFAGGELPESAIMANLGQWHPAARYRASVGALRAWFADGGLVYDLTGSEGKGHVLRWSLVGADGVRPSGKGRVSGQRSWMVGENRIEDVPAYNEIFYSSLLPGVDARFAVREGRLKYDLILAPGVDPSVVRMRYEGASGIEVDRSGALQVRTTAGVLSEERPVAFQKIGGKTIPVDARFVAEGEIVRIELGAYDRTRELVIDPAIRFSSYLGGNGFDEGRGVQVDSAGNIYIAGQTRSADFPVTPGAYSTTSDTENGSHDIFIAKLDPTGRRLIWGTYAGGNGEDDPTAGIRVRDNRVIVVGTTLSSNLKITPGVFGTGRVAGTDGFILSLNQTDGGSRIVEGWQTYLGGFSDDTLSAFDLNSSGNIVLTGYTQSFDFQFLIPAGSFDNTPSTGLDVFVMEISADGKRNVAGTFLAGAGDDRSTALVVGSGDRVTVAGLTYADDFPVSLDALFGSRTGLGDGFIAQLAPNMRSLDYGTYLGGSGDDFIRSAALDAQGRVYVTGHTLSADFPDNVGLSSPGSWFVTRIDPGAVGPAQLSYSLYLTSGQLDRGVAVAADNVGRAVLCGVTASPNFPILGGGVAVPGRGKIDLALVRLAADGSAIEQSSRVGGSEDDIPAPQVRLSSLGELYVTGSTRSPNFPLGRYPYDGTLNRVPGESEPDAFLLVWSFNSRPNLTAPSLIVMDTLGCETEGLDTFYVHNDGDLPLTIQANKFRISDPRFTLLEPSDLPNPPDAVRPGDSLRYIVRFATTEFGTYENDLQIYTSDSLPGKNPLVVTIRAGRVAPSVSGGLSILFGKILICRDTTIRYTLTNNNADAVTVEFPTFEGGGAGFRVDASSFPLVVPGRGRATVSVTFSPDREGLHSDALLFRVRECDQSVLRVAVSGRGEVQKLDGLPAAIAFPALPSCSQERDTVFTVVNSGDFALILREDLSGPGAFAAELPQRLPDTIAPRGTRQIRFRFAPPAPGDFDEEIRIRIGPCDSIIRIRLTGSHPDEIIPVPSVDTLDFGMINVCRGARLSVDQAFDIGNPSDSLITLETPILAAPFFSCGLSFPSHVSPRSSVPFCLRYDPPAGERRDTFRLLIPYSVGDCTDTMRVLLVGGRSVAELIPDLTEIDLPPLNACESFRDTSVMVRNNSAAPISLDSAHRTRGLELPGMNFPATIPAGDSLLVRVRFAPTTSGNSEESLRFYYSAPPCRDSFDLAVTGRAEGIVVTADRDSVAFDPVMLCAPPTEAGDTLYLTRTGTTGGSVTIAAVRFITAEDVFAVVDPAALIGAEIPEGAPLPVPLRFSSGTKGKIEGMLEIITEPCTDTIRVLMMGEVVEPEIEISGGNFGGVEVGTSVQRNVIIRNSSPIPLELDTLAFAGTPFAPAAGFPALPAVLGSGQVVVLPVTFTPEATGDFRDSAALKFSGACDRFRTAQLSGTGIRSEVEVEFCIGGIYSDPGLVGEVVTIPVRADVPAEPEAPVDLLFLFRFDPDRFEFLDAVGGRVVSQDGMKGEVLVRAEAVRSIPQDLPSIRLRILAGSQPFAVVRLDSAAVESGSGILPALCPDSAIVSAANRCFVTGLSLGKFPNRLERPVPNPVNAFVEITFQQLEDAETALIVWDAGGREVLRPLQGELRGGRYSVRFSVEELPAGLYFYGVRAGSWSATGSMIVRQ